ncbi:Hypothetical predicted protein [Mytilus galloprovincialis]|uniref:Uncharacterized protein n=1 Tax=Mytilus galloprovincialis TaxID=29158 RepID=A0A8B6C329_MYTGA|nr:Hypothetical predicted protein [Mytilus galloprovincialis]
MPTVFKQSYRRCSSIIDCFEVFIQRPSQVTARAQTWSNNTNRRISFVSKAFGVILFNWMVPYENDNLGQDEEYNDSIETALMEEVGMYEDLTSIDIMTDARHGWRKNAKDSSVVAIGEKMHKVLKCEHITKADDFVSQRHEKLGTQRIYQNMSIKQVGKTWSEQLEDKVESVATHFHWAIRNCEQNPKELKDLLINVVEHYKNNHTKCHPDSRCKRDLNYEPKRSTINKPIAEKLLLGVIHKSVIFKSPDHFVLARDTSYVESFNNTMNMFQDKRIVFSDANYNTRACLAVCHWNENVDRGFTSI